MKIVQAFLFLIMILMAPCCNAEITGRVVDAETGEPIEGAVVLVEWTITKGLPGMSYSESYEVKEALTDKEGKIRISGVLNPLVKGHVTVYKKGYVAWDDRFIFPDYKKRTDFKWQPGYVFKLDKFKPEYNHNAHWAFIMDSVVSGPLEKKKLMMNAVKWEEDKAFEERRKKDSK